MRVWITGDTHGVFERIKNFCVENQTTKEDLLIIAGDAGINYNGFVKDQIKKEYLEKLPITLLCVHGNHEIRPESLMYYHEMEWCDGIVYVEDEYPSLLFAKDGEIYELLGKKILTVGGAYSIDKSIRNLMGLRWFFDEQPDDEKKAYTEQQLEECGWKADVVVTHTCPRKYEPVEWFLPYYDQDAVDKTTEDWLDQIEDRLSYEAWYCGHFHGEKVTDQMHFLFESFEELK